MTKKLIFILLIISIMVVAFGVAAAPTGQKQIRLRGTNLVNNQLVIKMDAYGYAAKAKFPASIYVDQARYALKCSYDGAKRLICKLNNANRIAGKQAIIWVNGFGFFVKLPGK